MGPCSPAPTGPALRLHRRWPGRGWRLLPLALMGLSAPAVLAQVPAASGVMAPGVEDALCRTMATPVVYGFTLLVALGTFAGLYLVKRRLTKEGWSLANALSEPTRLTIPLEWRWTESAGDQASTSHAASSSRVLRGPDGTPMGVTLMEASSSRMIATLGGLAILMLFMGFGTFALFSFGLTCQLPAAMPAVTTFLLSGLSLFAPYVANKASAALQSLPGRSTGPASPSEPPASARDAIQIPTQASPQRPLQAPLQPQALSHPAVVVPRGGSEGIRPEPALPVPAPPEGHRAATATAAVPERTAASAGAASPGASPGRDLAATAPAAPVPAAEAGRTADRTTAPAAAATAAEDPAALDLIRRFEGFVDHAYPDPASGGEPWTIGYGFTTLEGRPVQPGQTISREQAELELQRQVQNCARHLAGCIPYWAEMNGNQRAALIDFAWNLGSDFYGDEANFATISADLRDRAWERVPAALTLYCNPGTAVTAGLLRRRQAEADLWRTPVATAASTPASIPVAGPEPTGMDLQPGSSAVASPAAASPAAAAGHRLNVPYCDQLLMADGQGWRECFSASAAMLAMYWGREPNENVYDALRARYGDSTSSEVQLQALRSLGLQADFRTDGTVELLKQEINAGRPVAVGWLCDGPVSGPTGGGHWSVIIGYDADGVLINDPYGNCDLVNGGYLSHHDGAGLHYSFRNWVPRWRVEGSGGWMLTCRWS